MSWMVTVAALTGAAVVAWMWAPQLRQAFRAPRGADRPDPAEYAGGPGRSGAAPRGAAGPAPGSDLARPGPRPAMAVAPGARRDHPRFDLPMPGAGRDGVRREATSPGTAPERPRPGPLLVGAAGCGVAVGVVVGGWAGAFLGAGAAVAAFLALRTLEPASARKLRQRAVSDLPLTADLLAATLRSGAPVDRAVSEVAEALGGPLAVHLGRVARSLRLGAAADEAWGYLTAVPGAERVVAAAVRSSASGAALSGALTRLAGDLRADRTIAAQVAAHRAGVLVVLPLGLCFLPAFVLAGLAPVIIAVLSDLL